MAPKLLEETPRRHARSYVREFSGDDLAGVGTDQAVSRARLTHSRYRSIHWFHILSPIKQSARLRGEIAAIWRIGKSRPAISSISLRRIAGTNSDGFRTAIMKAPIPPITPSPEPSITCLAIVVEQSGGIDQRSGDRCPVVLFGRCGGEFVCEGKGHVRSVDQRPGDDGALKTLAAPFDIGCCFACLSRT